MLACRGCGEEYEKSAENALVITEKKEHDTEYIDIETKDNMPKTEEDCEECGHNEAYWWMLQTRAADEPETRFFRCTECSHTWREYD